MIRIRRFGFSRVKIEVTRYNKVLQFLKNLIKRFCKGINGTSYAGVTNKRLE